MMLDDALAWVERGFAVFPLKPKSKLPLTEHGFKDASRDQAAIRQWWSKNPRANIGLATGNGFYVVDIDGPNGEAAYSDLCQEHGIPETLTVSTGRGRHLYFRSNGKEIPCSIGRIATGIDVRGAGGYVVAPPSVHPSGSVYSIIDSSPIAEWALADLALQDSKPPIELTTSPHGASRYSLAALDNECRRVAASAPGTRNSELNKAAFNLGQFVGAGELSLAAVEGALLSAARQCGLEAKETQRTLDSGLGKGIGQPRRIPVAGYTQATSREAPSEKIYINREALANGGARDELRHDSGADVTLPLFPPLPDAESYPVDALGFTLSHAAKAIASKVQVPCAMAAQSVLATASLAACAHSDVLLPFGQPRPLTLFIATVAASGDRKTTADNEALWPVRKYEKNLREVYDSDIEEWRIESAAWMAQKRKIEGNSKIGLAERRSSLVAIGKEPEKPLSPFLVAGDPTIEGLTKNWSGARAALGLFTAEGGSFTGGHGMNEDNRLKTGAMLSELWDGLPIKRIRATDGITILPGRRLAMHVMIQPDAARAFLSNDELKDQGLLSRVMVTRPESLAGARLYKEAIIGDGVAIKTYGARLLSILETPPALAEGKRNELAPQALPLSPDATKLWIEFHDHVEVQLAPDGPLAPIKGFAAKAAEQAARIAGVITIVEYLHAPEINAEVMAGAITLADWYVNEALRLQQAGKFNPTLIRAAALLEWMQAQPDRKTTFREILRLGPNQTRIKASADEALAILASHNWITEASTRPRVIQAKAPV